MAIEIIQDNRDQVARMIKNGIEKALKECGETCETYAKAICPVDTGNLRRSINNQMIGDNKVQIGTDVYYGKFVETGRYKQPFLKPAIKDHQSQYERIFKDNLRGGLL